MKKIIILALVGSMSFSTLAATNSTPQTAVSAVSCYGQVTAITNPKLEALRTKLRRAKATDGRSYYEVMRLYRTFRLSAKKYNVVHKMARKVEYNITGAITYCQMDDGEMDGLKKGDQKLRPSANDLIYNEAFPAIKSFYKVMDKFIITYYNKAHPRLKK